MYTMDFCSVPPVIVNFLSERDITCIGIAQRVWQENKYLY